MADTGLSIVIPVCNKWELTRSCLASLASSGAGDDLEVIVVDNASTDATVTACAPTGRALFGERFRILRQESNRHFAAACNTGGREASGQWLFFLNNDTRPLPGWRPPLHEAFAAEPTLGAAGPLLLYPSAFGLPDRVQHLGIHFNPDLKIGHLYEFFPAAHPLARRRRRLQAITAAALLLPRDVFLGLGGFHEGFVNGFEDVDFCVRLGRAGYRMSVVPESRVYHLCGQTPGRGAHDAANALLLTSRCGAFVHPDSHTLLREDGYRLRLTPWLTFEPGLTDSRAFALSRLMGGEADEAALRGALEEEPYWREGYAALADALEARERLDAALGIRLLSAQVWLSPPQLVPLYRLARRIEPLLAPAVGERMRAFAGEAGARGRQLRRHRHHLRAVCPELAADADHLLATLPDFLAREYLPFAEALREEGLLAS